MTYYITYADYDGDDLMLHYETNHNSPEWLMAVMAGGDVSSDGAEVDIVLDDRDQYRAITGE